jgi:2-dehydro-3-deoxy-D-arabinonate dehydratase
MRLLEFRTDDGKVCGGVIEGQYVRRVSPPVARLLSLASGEEARGEIRMPEEPGVTYAELERSGRLVMPVEPSEVWGAGVTYRPSADFRDADTQAPSGIYGHVYAAERPELFFKATASRCVGPDEPIGIRQDAAMTAPEPELAVVIGHDGRILAYTLGNDVSAWSIERENPLYLPQSKTYRGCCALGPVLVTADEIPDPRDLELHCRVLRGAGCVFEGSAKVSQMRRSIPELVKWLLRCNEVPDRTVLLTGTGIIIPHEAALAEGDVVEIRCDAIGTLRNPCRMVASTISAEATV